MKKVLNITKQCKPSSSISKKSIPSKALARKNIKKNIAILKEIDQGFQEIELEGKWAKDFRQVIIGLGYTIITLARKLPPPRKINKK